jgi:UDP-glucuronate 4-epimerase
MKILVTGAAGFIGSNLCKKLLADNHEVFGIDDLNDYYSPLIKIRNVTPFFNHPRFFLTILNIENRNRLEEIFKKKQFDAIVHLAARAGVRASLVDPLIFSDANFTGTANLLEFSRRHGIKQFIFASSSSVYGERDSTPFNENDACSHPVSPYAASKRACELFCYTYGKLFAINITILRFFNVYGPNNRPDMGHYLFAEAFTKNLPIKKYGDGSSKRDFTYIDDIVNGIILAINKPFEYEIINLGNNKPICLNEMISHFSKNFGKQPVIEQLERQSGDVSQTQADITKAKKLLNWEPTVPYHEGVKMFIEWFKNQS